MPTVVRRGNLRVVIYPADHEPAHVHVFGDGETKIELGDSKTPPIVIYSIGAKRSEYSDALRLVRDNQVFLLAEWAKWHG
jgi:Domain of unknown function (DUF4160)